MLSDVLKRYKNTFIKHTSFFSFTFENKNLFSLVGKPIASHRDDIRVYTVIIILKKLVNDQGNNESYVSTIIMFFE